MTSKYESAKLILELYDLRREETMRKARDWFMMFNPESLQDIGNAVNSEHSGYFRMVISYWDMAASFVNNGAIDEQMFADANGEHIAVFAKLHPFITEIRAANNSPTFLQHLEQLVMGTPNAEERMAAFRERLKQIAAARSAAQAAG